MRMKEDHMRNGHKPGYNVQISTNNQFIASYSLHSNPTDTRTLIPHLQQHIKAFKQKPANITADAGYGSEQNYQWLENKRITAYVKHNEFDRDQSHKKRDKNKPYAARINLSSNPATNRYRCPGRQRHEKDRRAGSKPTTVATSRPSPAINLRTVHNCRLRCGQCTPEL